MQYPEVKTQTSISEIQKNNKQIAHDLRSPISALNLVASLAPEIQEGPKELLSMAIARLQEMANQLESQK